MAEKLHFQGPVSSSNPTGIVPVSPASPVPTMESFGANVTTKSVTYTGAAGLGSQTTTVRFTVSGVVKFRLFAVCGTDLAGASATIAAGVTGNNTALIAATTATGIDTGHLWFSNTPGFATAISNIAENITSKDINETIATANITGGQLTYYCLWTPVSDGATVTAA